MTAGESAVNDAAVAVIGMACRLPGAGDVEQLWRNLRGGVESILQLSDADLEAEGIAAEVRADPRFVAAGTLVEGYDRFDPGFFGYTPEEAAAVDPQQRLFLECAWEALEAAGYDPRAVPGVVGVYAAAAGNDYARRHLYPRREILAAAGRHGVALGNDADYLAARVSYKLDLKGPSVNVQCACSSSLVAVHLACESVLNGECDLALAGGVSLRLPQRAGYLWEEGGIASPDGHCRAFDARAAGTVFGSGLGVVVLRPLAAALEAGDPVAAVIRGSAVNNDGAGRVGFTAPGVDGQAEVITSSLAVAGVEPDTITCVEAHGTGTALGDPIEVEALTQAFRTATGRRGFCALGSIKTNVGHLETASGVASLIKMVLALQHRQIPPSLHYRTPNPRIDFAASPFYVNARLADWPAGDGPRRAGVSSFGIGGTNAHLILEEAPAPAPASAGRGPQLLVLSARTPAALEAVTARLRRHLERHRDLDLADVAYTLQTGRRAFEHRRALIASSVDEALAGLGGAGGEVRTAVPGGGQRGGRAEPATSLEAFAGRWLSGGEPDGAALYADERRRRVVLPTYPFERRRCWVPAADRERGTGPRRGGARDGAMDLSGCFYLPYWKPSPASRRPPAAAAAGPPAGWLLLLDEGGLGAALQHRLEAAGQRTIGAVPGKGFARLGERRFSLRPGRAADHEALLRAAQGVAPGPWRIVHLGSLDAGAPAGGDDGAGDPAAGLAGLHGLLALARALDRVGGDLPVTLDVVTRGMQPVAGEAPRRPEQAVVLGFCRARQGPGLRCRSLDLPADGPAGPGAALLAAELLSGSVASSVAWRCGERWEPAWAATPLGEAGPHQRLLRREGVYLVTTDGDAGPGLALAAELGRRTAARLVVVVPPGSGPLRLAGCEVALVRSALAAGAAEAVAIARDRFAALHGVIHAGTGGAGAPRCADKEPGAAGVEAMLAGTRGLLAALEGVALDFLVLCPPSPPAGAAPGDVAAAAAGAYLDALAHHLAPRRQGVTVAVDLDPWWGAGRGPTPVARRRLSPGDGVEALGRILAVSRWPQVLVSGEDPAARRSRRGEAEAGDGLPGAVAPGAVEALLREIWAQVLGVEEVGPRDGFFDLGGDSLAALQVASRARSRGLELDPEAVLEHPTPSRLAAAVSAGSPPGPAPGSGPADPPEAAFDPDPAAFARLLDKRRAAG